MPAEKTPEPIHLEVRQVALAAKLAFDEGRLSAQGPKPSCAYRDRIGRPCAVGAALDDATALRFDASDDSDVSTLCDAGLLDADDMDLLMALQKAHDGWAGCSAAEVTAARADFLATLNSILGEA